MSLLVSKLAKVRELPGGIMQAQCPACAEGGHDKKGEHLRIYPDGRFGCCVHPKDREHRKRIFALAGNREPRAIKVKVAVAKTGEAIQSGLLGRLGRVFGSPTEPGRRSGADCKTPEAGGGAYVGTLGTGISYLRAYARGGEDSRVESQGELIEFERGVPSVPEPKVGREWVDAVPSVPRVEVELPPKAAGERLPFLTADGTLVIPFDSPERYHWWKPGGQAVSVTLTEIRSATAGKYDLQARCRKHVEGGGMRDGTGV